MYKDSHVTKWVVGILSSMGSVCQEGFLIPIYVLFYSEVASYDILTRKRNIRMR